MVGEQRTRVRNSSKMWRSAGDVVGTIRGLFDAGSSVQYMKQVKYNRLPGYTKFISTMMTIRETFELPGQIHLQSTSL